METLSKTLSQTSLKHWVKTSKDKHFTCDHVIDAYQIGKKEGLDITQRLIQDKLMSNIDRTGSFANELFDYLNSNGLNPINSYMRVNHWDDFNIMFIIPEKEFLNEKIYNVYDYFSEYEEERLSDLFNFSISLCGYSDSETFNEGKLFADGFMFKLKE